MMARISSSGVPATLTEEPELHSGKFVTEYSIWGVGGHWEGEKGEQREWANSIWIVAVAVLP